jgi:hypothetical protein
MAHMLSDLRSMNIDHLIMLHDFEAKQSGTDVKYYLAEIARRDQDRQTEAMLLCNQNMLKYTHRMLLFTIVVTVATLLNLVAVVIPLVK